MLLYKGVIINNDLGGISFGVDSNGNYGYKKDGADTVYPFKSTTDVTVAYASGWTTGKGTISGSVSSGNSYTYTNNLGVALLANGTVSCSSSANFYTEVFVYVGSTKLATITKGNSYKLSNVSIPIGKTLKFETQTNSTGSYSFNLSLS